MVGGQTVLILQRGARIGPVEVVQRVAQLQDDPVIALHLRAALRLGRAEQQHPVGMDLRQAQARQGGDGGQLVLLEPVRDVEDRHAQAVGQIEEIGGAGNQMRVALAFPQLPGVVVLEHPLVPHGHRHDGAVVQDRLVDVAEDGQPGPAAGLVHRRPQPKGCQHVALPLQGAHLGRGLLVAHGDGMVMGDAGGGHGLSFCARPLGLGRARAEVKPGRPLGGRVRPPQGRRCARAPRAPAGGSAR